MLFVEQPYKLITHLSRVLCKAGLVVPVCLTVDVKLGAQTAELYTSALSYSLSALNTSYDGRAAALGGVSVSTMADASSPYLNLAKLPFHSKKYGTSISYSPILFDLIGFSVPGVVMQGFYNFGSVNQNSVSAGVQFISFGEVPETDLAGKQLSKYTPSQFSGFLGYSRRFGKFSLGASFQIVNQSVAQPSVNLPSANTPSNSLTFSGNIGAYYSSGDREALARQDVGEVIVNAGLSIKNIGPKVKYLSVSAFQPANITLGVSIVHAAGENFVFQHSLELKKLLIPLYPSTNNSSIEAVKSYFNQDLFASYGKALGQLETSSIHLGVEAYIANPGLFVRAGGSYGKYLFGEGGLTLTAGLGYKYQDFGVHFAYNFTPWSVSYSSLFLTIFWDVGGYVKQDEMEAFDLDGFSVEDLFPELE